MKEECSRVAYMKTEITGYRYGNDRRETIMKFSGKSGDEVNHSEGERRGDARFFILKYSTALSRLS